MFQEEINVNLRSHLQIVDKTDENKPRIILSNIITDEKMINNITSKEENRKHNHD